MVATYWPLLLMGGLFVLLGLVFLALNRIDRREYYDSILLTRKDVREFLEQEPDRPGLNAWEIGGKISLVLGVLMLVAAGVLWLVV